MWWLAAMAAAKGVQSYLGSRAQAEAQQMEGAEQLRRMRAEHAATLGRGTAAAGASGVEGDSTSSLSRYLADMQKEFTYQENWAQQALDAGVSATKMAGTWTAMSDFGAGLYQYGQASNWGRAPAMKPTDKKGTP